MIDARRAHEKIPFITFAVIFLVVGAVAWSFPAADDTLFDSRRISLQQGIGISPRLILNHKWFGFGFKLPARMARSRRNTIVATLAMRGPA